MVQKYVYFFGNGKAEGKADMRNLLGGKGANLAEMTNLGLPIPQGFTITTEVCTCFTRTTVNIPRAWKNRLKRTQALESHGSKFGIPRIHCLFRSLRCRVSMPGMMDTVLNLGLNDETVEGLIKNTGNARLHDAQTVIQMFGNVELNGA